MDDDDDDDDDDEDDDWLINFFYEEILNHFGADKNKSKNGDLTQSALEISADITIATYLQLCAFLEIDAGFKFNQVRTKKRTTAIIYHPTGSISIGFNEIWAMTPLALLIFGIWLTERNLLMRIISSFVC